MVQTATNREEPLGPGSASPSKSAGLSLGLMGFLTLFLELVLIRYLSGNIWNLGYFPNLVLLAVFMGMGSGFVFHHHFSGAASPWLLQLASLLLCGLLVLVFYLHPAVPGFSS